MSDLTVEKRVEALEAKVTVIATGLNTILTELAGIGEAEKAETERPSWDASKIKWEQAEGNAGPYERSEDVNNLDFKAMVKDLAEHKGKLSRDNLFYWLFQNGTTVGRKKRRF